MAEISGTFNGLGSSKELVLSQGMVALENTGGPSPSTVQLQIYIAGSWRAANTYTNDAMESFDHKVPIKTRLACTSFVGSPVDYAVIGLRHPS